MAVRHEGGGDGKRLRAWPELNRRVAWTRNRPASAGAKGAEMKLPGAANRFYEQAIAEHFGIENLQRLASNNRAMLHSR